MGGEGRGERPYTPPVANSWLRHCLGVREGGSGVEEQEKGGHQFSFICTVQLAECHIVPRLQENQYVLSSRLKLV